MATSERLVTVSLGPLSGRVMMLETYLDNMQAVMTTLGLEARDANDEELESFILHLLQLSDGQFTAAKEQLARLKELLESADVSPTARCSHDTVEGRA